MERTWEVTVNVHRFEVRIYIKGTEQELWDYLRPDFGGDENTTGNYSYHAIGKERENELRKDGIKFYLAGRIYQ